MEKNSLRNQLDTTPDYINFEVAAHKLHVCANTLKNWLRDGKLKGVKVFHVDKTIRFERKSFFNFIENNSRIM